MRFLLRLVGYVLIAAGFVTLVIDGARSIANSTLQFTSLGEAATAVLRERYLLIQPAVERQLHPLLWDPVLVNLLATPAEIAALLLGFLLVRAGARPEPGIGVVTRP